MKKYTKFVYIILLGCLITCIYSMPVYSQEDMTVIDNSTFESPKRPSSIFVHDSHNSSAGIDDCRICHHVYDDNGKLSDNESSEDKKCADCHEIKSSGKMPGLMKAYHANCKGCHIEKGLGPIMCGQCHKNNSK